MVNDTLKDAIYETIHHSVKPLKAIADEINLAESTVNRWGLPSDDPDQSGSNMPLRYLVGLTRITGNYRVIEYLCLKLGGIFVKAPSVARHDNDLKTILNAQKKAADWISLAADAMIDGTMTDAELLKIIKKGNEVTAHNEQLKLILVVREGRAA